jgi:hypothetical protein
VSVRDVPARPRLQQFLAEPGVEEGATGLIDIAPSEFDIAEYGMPAPGLHRHEVLQTLWLKLNGFIAARLKEEASRRNPVILLSPETHAIVNRYQRALKLHDPAVVGRLGYDELLALNAEALWHAGLERPLIGQLMGQAKEYAESLVGRTSRNRP